MKYLVKVVILFVVFYPKLHSQYTLSGYVTNENKEALFFTTVFLEETEYATTTDNKGYFEIFNIPEGSYKFKASFIGYSPYRSDILINSDMQIDIKMKGEIYRLDAIEIQANRVDLDAPFTKQNLTKAQLEKENLAVDVPFLLQWTPSFVTTSDAGAGIGYTGLRLRGSDQTRINVTINGVPLNDAESQNVFWVDLPDLMASVKNIQIQRGVGTSTNGAGAFGGTISINTSDYRINPYIQVAGTFGSFDTRKASINLGTGLLNNRYVIDGRISTIKSDGYVDRASSDLTSMSFSAARISEKSSLKFNVLTGKEITYQSWYGIPESLFNEDTERLKAHYSNNLGSIYKTKEDSINLFNSGKTYNYYTYPNQVDNYRQTHLQLIHSLQVNTNFKIKSTMFYTKGKGYYEEFRSNDALENYKLQALPNNQGNIPTSGDIVRRRWLNNDFFGGIFDYEFHVNPQWQMQGGISYSRYIGSHFGNVIHSSVLLLDHLASDEYYSSKADKSDLATYIKSTHTLSNKLSLHFDLQFRNVKYETLGDDNDLRSFDIKSSQSFFNPKFGLNFKFDTNQRYYVSVAVAQKEPSRGDFVDRAYSTTPKPERLINYEFGYQYQKENILIESNIYYMDYKDQLVLTGELNDVGAPIRTNVNRSYRMGVENSIQYKFSRLLSVQANSTLSRNKIIQFDELLFDYTNGFEEKIIKHKNTNILFSPDMITSVQILMQVSKNFQAELSSKFVSSQYLDNTSDKARSLEEYRFENLRLTWSPKLKFCKDLDFTLLLNNLFNSHYASNGYTYSYIYGSLITENYLYPQAGRHFMLGLKAGF